MGLKWVGIVIVLVGCGGSAADNACMFYEEYRDTAVTVCEIGCKKACNALPEECSAVGS